MSVLRVPIGVSPINSSPARVGRRIWQVVVLVVLGLITSVRAGEMALPAVVEDAIPKGCTHYAHNPSGRLAYRAGRVPQSSAGGYVWVIPCRVYLADTTQVVIWQSEQAGASLLTFRQWDHGAWLTTPYLSNVTYDEKSGVLTSLHRDDSLGDCGTWTTWRTGWFRFEMLRLEAKTACDGREGPYRIIYQTSGEHPS